MKKTLFFLSAFMLAGLFFEACKKDSDTASETTAKAIAEDLTAHNDLGAQVDLESDAAAASNFAGAEDRGDCPVITYQNPKGTWPNTITLDFGDSGCTKPDGRTFKGKIIIYQTAKMVTTGAQRTTSFDNFYVEGVKVEGSRSLTNNGLNASGQPTFTRTGNETLTFPDGSKATHTATHTLTMTEGFGTALWTDDVWTISGTGSGTNRNGVAYTVNITNPLTKRAICPWIESGTIAFTHDNKTRTLDYGNGACDNDATLTLANGTVRTVKVRHHWWK